ncbi:hypothetical protein DRE_07222 [Drechslerella stenobrocha 248]|uniref:AGC-kinase C-terminal domain-containing protein n=1 Tax=Drechslerella stenobrocha 248 TaxID=1043628 RepID=W7HVL5_9PEZI|nr:hypothetical protein DRE_07222 [Drechslerella stenobrocha 248]
MSLLLRRRSGQSSHSAIESSSGAYGAARELPDDFDPGIIYGTRHPPRRSITTQPINNPLRGGNGARGGLGGSISDETSPQAKDVRLDNTHRQAHFTEHFSDVDTALPTSSRLDRAYQFQTSNAQGHNHHANVTSEPRASASVLTTGKQQTELLSQQGPPAESMVVLFLPKTVLQSPTLSDHSSDMPLDLFQNSSRFSFEASSAADSVRNEELTLSDSLAKKLDHRSQFDRKSRSSDAESFRSDDMQSITSEDLRCEDGDGFGVPFVDYSQAIAPPPGFESVVVNTVENARRLQQIALDELTEAPTSQAISDGASLTSSEIGTNGSNTDEEGEGEGEEEPSAIGRGGAPCPPFVNPPGPGLHHTSMLAPRIDDDNLSNDRGIDKPEQPSLLLFQNAYQTDARGVNEYDTGTPSAFLGFQPLTHASYDPDPIGDEADDGDEDDMIAEANRDALASDSDGWYGHEFGFYPASSTNSTYLAGGFFGIDLPKPGFIRNPSLTPISERSEGSLRNSLSIMSPTSITHGGISAGPLSAALFTELANNEQINCDEATLTQLQLLNGLKHQEDNFKYLTMIASSPSTAAPSITAPMVNSPDGLLFPAGNQTPVMEQSRSSLAALDDLSNCHADVSTSYVHDVDLGWVMEKRRGGELIQRELVQGAV